MHCCEELWHALDGLAMVEDGGVLRRWPRLSPSNAFPRGVVFGHKVNFMHEIVLTCSLSSGVVGVKVRLQPVKEELVFS
jgi:hypothetical protein